MGLVWTSFGGEVQFVEATTMVGKGDLHLTGQLGDVIKESAQIALTWVISHNSIYIIIHFIYIYTHTHPYIIRLLPHVYFNYLGLVS